MELIGIQNDISKNVNYYTNALLTEALDMAINYYAIVGYQPPWICYFAKSNDHIVGVGAFKGAPRDKKVEIAYSTFEPYRKRGYGFAICKALVDLAFHAEEGIEVIARTLKEQNESTGILIRNGFVFSGEVEDPDDGAVWEWRLDKS